MRGSCIATCFVVLCAQRVAAVDAPVPTTATETTDEVPLSMITIPWRELSFPLPETDANPAKKIVVYLCGTPYETKPFSNAAKTFSCASRVSSQVSDMSSAQDKRSMFRQLHENGCFAIPNPWDIGSARYLQHLGFKALATTSAGFAFSRGLPDGAIGRDEMLAHIREVVVATDLPVNADFENGYADDPNDVADSVRLCVATGVAGLSIEDATDRKEQRLYDVDLAVERIKAARQAIGESGVLLVGRAEGFLVGREDLKQVVRRLVAYSEAGADCLYAPGFCEREHIKSIVAAVAPKPVNILIGGSIGLTMKDAAALGARRVSVGGAFARAAWGGFIRAAKELVEHGSFNDLANAVSYADLQSFFEKDAAKEKEKERH